MDSSKFNVLRASLGSTAISEMQNAYYTLGLSLAELREDYDLPSGFTDSDFIAGSVEKVGVEPHPKRVGPASWNLEYG